ncbi:MAG: LacI family DNA-binding transcriptional regulator [Cetobacterium sp.]
MYGSSYFKELVALVTEAAEEKNIKILLSIVKNSESKMKIKSFIDNGMIQGAIVIGVKLDEPELEKMAEQGYNLIVFDYKNTINYKNVFLINSNNYEGGRLAARYLLQKGIKKIFHLEGTQDKLAGVEIKDGFLDEIDGHGIIYKILPGNFQFQLGKNLLKDEIRKGNIPEGIFCANDEMALGCLEAIYEEKIEDKNIAVVGFDNTLISSLYRPKLTTIGYNSKKMSQKAIEIIERMINKEDLEEFIYESEITLEKRDT